MPSPYVYSTFWFLERRDRDGVWHTVADRQLLEAQKALGPAGTESYNLQWQFVRDTAAAYDSWAGWNEGSHKRWPSDVSKPARAWLDNLLAWIAEIPTLGKDADGYTIPVPRHSYGAVGPGDGLMLAWGQEAALTRFLARVDNARAALGCPAVATTAGWGAAHGHAALYAANAAQHLLPLSVRHARLVFATKF